MYKLLLLETLRKRCGNDKGRLEKLFLAALNVTKKWERGSMNILEKSLGINT